MLYDYQTNTFDPLVKELSNIIKKKMYFPSSDTVVTRLEKPFVLVMIYLLNSPDKHLSWPNLKDHLVKNGFSQVGLTDMFHLHTLGLVTDELVDEAKRSYILTPIGINVATWLRENKPAEDCQFIDVPYIAMWPSGDENQQG